VGGGLTVTSWWLDSEELEGAGNSAFWEFKAVELSVGVHHVTVLVESNGSPYTKEIDFQVVE
jgi:hypothetical protein